jgi:beta-glucosidase
MNQTLKQLAQVLAGGVVVLAASAAQSKSPPESQQLAKTAPVVPQADWARVTSPVPSTPALEARITAILQRLTLEQKVGQMIQPHIGAVTPEEAKRYHIGSVLNGGGQTPQNNPTASVNDWLAMAEAFYQASMSTEGQRQPVPIIWGTDAVHGHNNVLGATLIPHNIGLGATGNPDLVRALGEMTAKEVAATGIDWTFAPTLAVVQDDRWGRTYESFSEDAARVAQLGAAFVEGLQGRPGTPEFLSSARVIATAKHFIGDGGTQWGDDQGFTEGDEAALLRTHLPPYVSTLNQGVQTMMASYSSWNGLHSHDNPRLVNQLLKGQLGFDGLLVSDWQALSHVPGCQLDSCPQAVNAGVDLFMIPNAPDWKSFHANLVRQVTAGQVPMARIDDAVRRILRVKLRAGLFDKPGPMARAAALKVQLGDPSHRALARQAVRESLVLLKNTPGVLPIAPGAKVLVTGPGVDSLAMQHGGWSITWQGRGSPNEYYRGATSIYAGLQAAIKAAGGQVTWSPDGRFSEKPDVAVVIFGEQPYAEMEGDIQNLQTLEVEAKDKTSWRLMRALQARQIPVVAVLLTGRALWVNKELNASDAFVVGWLPGSEGAGVADVLVAKADGKAAHDFIGRLPVSWPATPCQTPLNKGSTPYEPLFALDYGLSYTSALLRGEPLSEQTNEYPHGCMLPKRLPKARALLLTEATGWRWRAEEPHFAGRWLGAEPVTQGPLNLSRDAEEDAVMAVWQGGAPARLVMRNSQSPRHNLLPFLAQQGAVQVDVKLLKPFGGKLEAVLFSGPLTSLTLDISSQARAWTVGEWHTLRLDLQCFTSKVDFSKIDGALGFLTTDTLALAVKTPSYQPSAANTATIRCR